jgi:hypothetical protein
MEERRQINQDAIVVLEVTEHDPQKNEMPVPVGAGSLVRRQAAELLRRARRLPVGPDRNDLRQVAIGLLWLDKKGLASRCSAEFNRFQIKDAASLRNFRRGDGSPEPEFQPQRARLLFFLCSG